MEIGDLSCIGFWGFAAVTFCAGAVSCNWWTNERRGLYHAFIMVGGLGQIFGGICDILRNNAAGGVILCGFGLYWTAEGLAAWPGLSAIANELYEDPIDLQKLIGTYRVCWALFCLPMVYTMFRRSLMQGVTLMVVACIFFLHGFSGLFGGSVKGSIDKFAGYLMLLAAVLAYYLGCGVYLKASGCKGLPFGPAFFTDKDHRTERLYTGDLVPEYVPERIVVGGPQAERLLANAASGDRILVGASSGERILVGATSNTSNVIGRPISNPRLVAGDALVRPMSSEYVANLPQMAGTTQRVAAVLNDRVYVDPQNSMV